MIMNILQAKQQIINTVKAYMLKDEYGRYAIPQHKQRPLLLMGPPGIGKTEIVHQAAQELGIGLLSYSMTHHTRQTALGLPIIKHKIFNGVDTEVSQYTVSEIIADVYALTEETGIKNGILFLDEVNCISETLMPVMLQFLQYKVFGHHRLPEGWTVVAAGNPLEYNSSARSFDVAVLDRLKKIDVKESFDVWKNYAKQTGVHNAVLTYLDLNKKNFYSIGVEAEGFSYVTARGWEDLSRILKVYEAQKTVCDEALVSQYIGNEEIASDFYIYYDLYNKYKKNYSAEDILDGRASASVRAKALKAGFNERYSLLGILVDKIKRDTDEVLFKENNFGKLTDFLKTIKDGDVAKELHGYISELNEKRKKLKAANSLSYNTETEISFLLEKASAYLSVCNADPSDFEAVKQCFDSDINLLKEETEKVSKEYSNMFKFCVDVYDVGNEALLLITELTVDLRCARFLSYYGCKEYKELSDKLMLTERRNETAEKIDKLLKESFLQEDGEKPKKDVKGENYG